MKHYTFDVIYERKPAAVKWAKQTFGPSKPAGVKMSKMQWYKRDMLATNPPGFYGSRYITRFYFKNEADLMMFRLKWA